MAVAAAVKSSTEQIVCAPPAFAVGASAELIVKVIGSFTVVPEQLPEPVTAIVSVTEPAVISAALGV